VALPTRCDVTIIGAGPAGSSSAALLHKAGLSAVVIEKQKFPRFVIGESLLPRVMDLLAEADLLEVATSRQYLRKFGALFLRGDERCDFLFSNQFTDGWDHTWQVPRADFDKTLADAAGARGVPFAYEHEVLDVSFGDEQVVTYADSAGKKSSIRSRFVIDASGYGRVLPRLLKLDEPSRFPARKAVLAHFHGDERPEGPHRDRIWVVCVQGGAWVWIIPFSNGLTSFGVVGEDSVFARYPSDPAACLRAVIDSDPNFVRLRNAGFEWEPKVIAGYAAVSKRLHGPGFVLVGNATEFLDPVFSSGVTLALESANRACKTLVRQLRGETVDWEVDYSDYMRRGIDVFRTYVSTWYDGTLPRIFFNEVLAEPVKNMICSVLAGYVWDETNPFVAQHQRKVAQLARIVG